MSFGAVPPTADEIRRALGPAPVRRSRVPALLTTGALLVAVALGVSWWARTYGPAARPPAGVEESRTPLSAPPLVPAGSGAYAFLQTQDDGSSPVAWSPCRPIHWVLRPSGAPDGGDALLAAAFADVAAATGLTFVADGPTDEAPADERDVYQPDRYGRRWAPVLVAWSDPGEHAALAGTVAGNAGGTSVTADGYAVYVSGQLVLDAPQIADLLTSPNGSAVARAVVTHELAHVVGLAHVDDPGQLMHPTADVRQVALGPGDREGLALLGAGRCAPHL
ncbi:MAG: matrixin family metalloprotease [Cellulomonas iranensis]|uniref:matrixin family metalloprotease n=1 Tax=Cellulomonas iranensis TaxID=76862 RepID=UPI001B08727E|nr:matrixin family metalloprotease [Cellulomonas iranensis]MBO9569662.1 matrixin family metalloprotease [Cellulomonas iranensis]